MAITILKGSTIKKSEENIDIINLKNFHNLLVNELKETFLKENLIKNSNIFNESIFSTTKNLNAKYFMIGYQPESDEEQRNYFMKFNADNIFLSPEEILAIVKKRYVLLDDYPSLNEKESNEEKNLKELLNNFSIKFLNISKEI